MSPDQRLLTVLHRNLKRALRFRHLDEAEAILEQLKAEDPLSRHTRGFELECLLARERLSEAASLARQLLGLYPESPRIHLLAGMVKYRKHTYEEAAELFRESVRLHPSDSQARQWLGRTLTQMGKLDEAERVLLDVLPVRSAALTDLAWLYERRGDIAAAIEMTERHLRERPADARALENLRRLRARQLQPGELQQEVEALADLGDDPDPAILPEYIEDLLQTGQGARARSVVAQRQASLDARAATRTGWVAYKLQAYDLALQLFLKAFLDNIENFKFLAALELAAERTGRLPEVAALYRTHASTHRNLFGHLRRIERLISGAR